MEQNTTMIEEMRKKVEETLDANLEDVDAMFQFIERRLQDDEMRTIFMAGYSLAIAHMLGRSSKDLGL